MTDKELIIAGLNHIDRSIEYFKEIKNYEAKLIMCELHHGLELAAKRLLRMMNHYGDRE